MATPAARAAAAEDQARFLTLVNQSRAAARLAPVAAADALATVAATHAAAMAAQNRLFHTPSLVRVLAGWSAASEAVGDSDVPPTVWVDTVHRQFMASGVHRAVILNPAVTHVGVGVAYRSGKAFVTEVYGRPAGGVSVPAVVRAPQPRVSRTRRASVIVRQSPRPQPAVAAPPPATAQPPEVRVQGPRAALMVAAPAAPANMRGATADISTTGATDRTASAWAALVLLSVVGLGTCLVPRRAPLRTRAGWSPTRRARTRGRQ